MRTHFSSVHRAPFLVVTLYACARTLRPQARRSGPRCVRSLCASTRAAQSLHAPNCAGHPSLDLVVSRVCRQAPHRRLFFVTPQPRVLDTGPGTPTTRARKPHTHAARFLRARLRRSTRVTQIPYQPASSSLSRSRADTATRARGREKRSRNASPELSSKDPPPPPSTRRLHPSYAAPASALANPRVIVRVQLVPGRCSQRPATLQVGEVLYAHCGSSSESPCPPLAHRPRFPPSTQRLIACSQASGVGPPSTPSRVLRHAGPANALAGHSTSRAADAPLSPQIPTTRSSFARRGTSCAAQFLHMPKCAGRPSPSTSRNAPNPRVPSPSPARRPSLL